mmetsp:Transcript_54685/g.127543  ORF Transcript_54685/g.127543 Transcript_54685/m.127543 type:complete len:82 (-) Transcript_54685:600-845(-)
MGGSRAGLSGDAAVDEDADMLEPPTDVESPALLARGEDGGLQTFHDFLIACPAFREPATIEPHEQSDNHGWHQLPVRSGQL